MIDRDGVLQILEEKVDSDFLSTTSGVLEVVAHFVSSKKKMNG